MVGGFDWRKSVGVEPTRNVLRPSTVLKTAPETAPVTPPRRYYNESPAAKGGRRQSAGGVTGRLWDMSDIVAIVEAAEPAPKKRGSYQKHGA